MEGLDHHGKSKSEKPTEMPPDEIPEKNTRHPDYSSHSSNNTTDEGPPVLPTQNATATGMKARPDNAVPAVLGGG